MKGFIVSASLTTPTKPNKPNQEGNIMTKLTIKIPGYLSRMLEEDIELERKTKALDTYISGVQKDAEHITDPEEAPCLCQEIDQLEAMMKYGVALNERIDTALRHQTRKALYKGRYDKEGNLK